ncbi:hypothetical protein ACQZ6S_14165 [Agrobacterium tumefaciens]
MIDGDPDLDQDAINQKRDWFASEGRAVFPAQVVHSFHRDRHDSLSLRQSSCKRLSAAGGFLIGDRVDDLEVLRGTQRGELLRPVRKTSRAFTRVSFCKWQWKKSVLMRFWTVESA